MICCCISETVHNTQISSTEQQYETYHDPLWPLMVNSAVAELFWANKWENTAYNETLHTANDSVHKQEDVTAQKW